MPSPGPEGLEAQAAKGSYTGTRAGTFSKAGVWSSFQVEELGNDRWQNQRPDPGG